MASAVTYLSGTNMATYDGPDPGHPHDLGLQQEPWKSTQTTGPTAAVGPWT